MLWMMLLIALGMMFAIMFGVALVANRWKNAGLVDIVWAGGFSLLAILYAVLGEGSVFHKLLIALPVSLASLRLALYLLQRFRREFPVEDGRYHALRVIWDAEAPEKTDQRFFWLIQFQGVLMVILSLPFALVCQNPDLALQWVEWAGLALWGLGFVGEAVADAQLQAFKANPDNRGKTCRAGLWRYSRHPNYFFEWLLWCAYFVMALGTPWGGATLYVPLVMLFFLTKVTGIAATEAHALKTRGEDYRDYQRTTSAFFPWPPKKLHQ